MRVAKNTAVTAGVRWAEYFGGREATFLSLGARQYFRGGSVAYRLTRTSADGQKAFYAHLVNLTIKDGGDSDGKTQLWASTGAASLARAQFDASFSGKDRAFLIQRTQPISPSLALLISGGISSYAAPTGRFTGTNIGLGLTADLD